MGLIKRQILPPLSYADPEITSGTDRFIVLMNLSQANNVGILEQLSVLFEYTHEIFSDLVEEATQTNERIKNLSERVVQLVESIPDVEAAPSHQTLRNPAVAYSNKSEEVACQFLPEHRVPSISRQYELCQPPPNLGVLDHIAGESCLKKYTNPMFFLETWIEEQEAIFLEAKKKRAQRRKGRQRTQTSAQKKVVKQVELSRAKYSAMGQEFSDAPASTRPVSTSYSHPPVTETRTAPPTSAPGPTVAPTATPAPAPTPAPTAGTSAPVSLRPKKDKKSSSSSDSNKRVSRRDTTSGSSKKEKTPREKKEKSDKRRTKRLDTKNFPPPSGVAPPPPGGQEDSSSHEEPLSPHDTALPSPKHPPLPVPPVAPVAPTPAPVAPTPAPVAPTPAPVAVPSPVVPRVTAPIPGGIPPPPAPPALAPPPAPGGLPPPPAPGPAPSLGGLAGALAAQGGSLQHREPVEKKPVETRSALLDSIKRGTQLRKVEVPTSKKSAEHTGAFNVAKILARRAAMEFSDEEGEFEDDEWED